MAGISMKYDRGAVRLALKDAVAANAEHAADSAVQAAVAIHEANKVRIGHVVMLNDDKSVRPAVKEVHTHVETTREEFPTSTRLMVRVVADDPKDDLLLKLQVGGTGLSVPAEAVERMGASPDVSKDKSGKMSPWYFSPNDWDVKFENKVAALLRSWAKRLSGRVQPKIS